MKYVVYLATKYIRVDLTYAYTVDEVPISSLRSLGRGGQLRITNILLRYATQNDTQKKKSPEKDCLAAAFKDVSVCVKNGSPDDLVNPFSVVGSVRRDLLILGNEIQVPRYRVSNMWVFSVTLYIRCPSGYLRHGKSVLDNPSAMYNLHRYLVLPDLIH